MSETIEFEAYPRTLNEIGEQLNPIAALYIELPPHAWRARVSVTLTPVEPELKPCPFCGGEAQAKHTDGSFGHDHVWVRCLHCPAQTMAMDTEVEAIAAWNRRNGD